MTCVNTNNIPYLITYDPSNPQNVRIKPNVGVHAKLTDSRDFYYIQFSNDQSFKVFDIKELIPEDIFNKIKDNLSNLFLVLDNGLEYFYSCADSIYKDIVIKHNIPAEKIIFLSAVPTMHEYVSGCAKKYNLPQIKVDWFSLFESTGQDAARKSQNVSVLEKKQKYERAFLNLNRRWRLHRPLMFTLLKDKGLLDKGYVSFAPADDNQNWNTAYAKLLSHYGSHGNIKPILDRNADVINTKPMYLDTEDLVTNRAIHEVSVNNYYSKTYFSLINETTYHEGVPFFSEKIFKAIAMGHPFIVATAPNSFQYLRELGYQTYHPYIDETYDTILDDGDRMIAIVNEVERLCNMNKLEFKEWRAGISSIAKRNKLVLTRKQNITRPMNYKHQKKAP